MALFNQTNGDGTSLSGFEKFLNVLTLGGYGNIKRGIQSYTGETSNNIALQNLQREQEYNETIWNREDNAQQIAALDMQRAGLSKTLAAGNGAVIGGSSMSPQLADTSQQGLSNLMAMANLLTDIDFKKAQTDNISSDTALKKLEGETFQLRFANEMANLESDTKLKDLNAEALRISNRYLPDSLKADLDNKIANLDLTYANIKYVEQDARKIANQICTEQQNFRYLEQQTKNASIEYTSKQVELLLRLHDAGLYDYYGLPSTGPNSSVTGMAFDTLANNNSRATSDQRAVNEALKKEFLAKLSTTFPILGKVKLFTNL